MSTRRQRYTTSSPRMKNLHCLDPTCEIPTEAIEECTNWQEFNDELTGLASYVTTERWVEFIPCGHRWLMTPENGLKIRKNADGEVEWA